jgi:hypothetical protein
MMKESMSAGNITELIDSLTPKEQEAVCDFILFLRSGNRASASPFLSAVDEFIEQHPELLRRLAQ